MSDRPMSQLDHERYCAFKRGIGHAYTTQPGLSLIGAHDAAIAYVHERRAADESGGNVARDDAEELRREGHA